MKKIFLPLGLLALIAAPSAGSANMVLDIPPILAGTSNFCLGYAGCPSGPCYPGCPNPCVKCDLKCVDYSECLAGPCFPDCPNPCVECCSSTCDPCNSSSCGNPCSSNVCVHFNDTGITAPTGGGQDADFGRDSTHNNNADGAAGFSFKTINSTCVLDNVTGLAWEVKTATNTGLTYDWAGAKSYAENFTGCGSTYTCRLPTVKELLGIVHFGTVDAPFIDPTFFPNTASSATYLSGTEVANAASSPSTHVWGVDFSLGNTDNAISKESDGYRVRAVCVPKP